MHSAVPARLASAIGAEMLEEAPGRLSERLGRLAEQIVRCCGLQGAIVIALDEEGVALSTGAHGLDLGDSEAFAELHRDLVPRLQAHNWTEVRPPFFPDTAVQVLALPVSSRRSCLGIVIVASDQCAYSSSKLQAVLDTESILAAAIQSSIYRQAWERMEQLQALAREAVGRQPWNFQRIVEDLARMFEAGAVTLFLRDQQELRFEVSTDPSLVKTARRRVVSYLPGQGLTGYIFQRGNALRLLNTSDAEEIRCATGLDRKGPVHPERDREGILTGQFLGVPLRLGSQVIGVLRMSRRKENSRFTLEDEKALQFFADLLGAALAPAWIARVTSETERQAGQHRRLLEFLEETRIAYFRADVNGITQESTPTDWQITGYTPDELKQLSRHALYRDPLVGERLLKRARENQGRLLREVAQMRRKNGEIFWAEGDLRILRDSEGREIGSEGFYRDVSDRIDLQRFLNEDTERVLSDDELFDRLKRDAEFHLDYIRSFSHQIQTPLGSLVETLRNFERGELGQKELVSRLPYVIGQAVVCTRLIRNMSYMDKILRGEPFTPERVMLRKLAIETNTY